jgi:hypothetical protein
VVRPPVAAVLDALRRAPWVAAATEVAPGEIELVAVGDEVVEAELVGLLTAARARVVSLGPRRRTLEEVFFDLTKAPHASAEPGARP